MEWMRPTVAATAAVSGNGAGGNSMSTIPTVPAKPFGVVCEARIAACLLHREVRANAIESHDRLVQQGSDLLVRNIDGGRCGVFCNGSGSLGGKFASAAGRKPLSEYSQGLIRTARRAPTVRTVHNPFSANPQLTLTARVAAGPIAFGSKYRYGVGQDIRSRTSDAAA